VERKIPINNPLVWNQMKGLDHRTSMKIFSSKTAATFAGMLSVFLMVLPIANAETGTMLVGVEVPLMFNGKIVGKGTLPKGTVAKILEVRGDKVFISASSGNVWIDRAQIDISPAPAPVSVVAATSTPIATPTPIAIPTPAVKQSNPVVAPSPAGKEATTLACPQDVVGGPEFITTSGHQSAGTASIVKYNLHIFILSARHLLGPLGGFKVQTASKDVPLFVHGIIFRSFAHSSHDYDVTPLLVPTKSDDPFTSDPLGDLALYQVKEMSVQGQPLTLGENLPAVGDRVWVAAHVRGGVPAGEVMHSAKVTWSKEGDWLWFQFDNDNIITAGASGAPVLNSAGEVVGVYSGHSKKDGHMLGDAVPSSMILGIIKSNESGGKSK